MNQVILKGNLTADVDVKMTTNGTEVTSFTVAVNERYKKDDGTYDDRAEFIKCVAWREIANAVGRMRKGTPVVVIGKIQTRSYEQDGVKKYVTEVVANFVGEQPRKEASKQTAFDNFESEVIPF